MRLTAAPRGKVHFQAASAIRSRYNSNALVLAGYLANLTFPHWNHLLGFAFGFAFGLDSCPQHRIAAPYGTGGLPSSPSVTVVQLPRLAVLEVRPRVENDARFNAVVLTFRMNFPPPGRHIVVVSNVMGTTIESRPGNDGDSPRCAVTSPAGN